ncbi:MAG TPA: rhodanese-like domain-containing protein, partial [Thermoplasmata archaeon]|nr:rhodanese-like domain-containing protein [Thermoplasmata archaeon]
MNRTAVHCTMTPVPGTPHPFPRAERPGSVPLVSPRELRRMLDDPDPPLVVDVRSDRERRLARLPNDRHLPLFELPKRFGELPIERSVVTYCQYGSDARRAAEFLRSHGYAVSALEGGLDEYSRIVDPTVPRYELDTPSGDLLLIQLPRPESGCLAYFLGDPSTHQAVVIDPGRDVDPYLAALG